MAHPLADNILAAESGDLLGSAIKEQDSAVPVNDHESVGPSSR